MTEQQKHLGYLSDRKYVTKHRAELNLKNRLRYRANREACLAYHARRRNGEKREAILRQKRQYHLNNKEQIRKKDQERGKTTHGRMVSSAASRRYAQTEHGREIKKILANNRRTAAGTFTLTEWHDCLARHDYKCAHCGSKDRIEIDHVRPIHLGGTNAITNLQPLCRSCNAKKGGRYVG